MRAETAPEIAVIGDRAGFDALKPEWDALFAASAAPHQLFQSHAFLAVWCDHYLGRDDRLCIVAGRRGGRLVSLWPLVRQRRFGLDRLVLMGAPVAQFGDVLVAEGEERALWLAAGHETIARLGADLFEARKVRDDAVLGALKAVRQGLVVQERQAPFADLAQRVGDDGPGRVYPARERSNHRRRLRRLTERGPLGFLVPPPGEEARAMASLAIALKRARLSERGQAAPVVADPRFAAFFEALAVEGCEAGLQVTAITCAGQPVGIDLSFDCKGVSFGHVIAGDPAFARDGIGRVLVHHVFAQAKARGNARFELMAPADPYKLEHADGLVAVRDLAIPLSRRGRIVCALRLPLLRPLLTALAKRLPAGVTRRLLRSRAS